MDTRRFKAVYIFIPLIAFTFLLTLLGGLAGQPLMMCFLTGFAVSSAWVIWYIRSRKLYDPLIFPGVIGVGLAIAVGAFANRILFAP